MAIFTAAGAAIAGALFAGSALAATLIAGGLALATSLAISYLMRPKKRKYSAVQGEVQFGGDVPVTALYGKGATKGHRVYYAKYGEGNKYNAEVFVLSNGWCDGLEPEIYFYGEKHTLKQVGGVKIFDFPLDFIGEFPDFSNWSEIDDPLDALNAILDVFGLDRDWTNFNEMISFIPDFVGGLVGGIMGLIQGNLTGPGTAFGQAREVWHVNGFGGKIVIRFFDGRPGQEADAALVRNTQNLANPWKNTSTLTGLTYVVVEREWDEELFKRGRPDFKFVLRGLREYDPRKDDTVAGGSGSHRIDDESTWEFTENPALHRLNYQIGLRGRISDRVIVGEGKSLGQLDLGSYFTAMNTCDTIRNGQETYKCSLFVSGDDDHTEVLREFDDAMAGYGMNRRGLSGVIPGAPQVAVMEITDEDIRVDEPIELKRRKSAFDLYNYISGQFVSPISHWEPESLTPVYSNADAAADGRVRQTSNDFLQVTDTDIAQYLLQIRYRQNRKGGSVVLPVSRRVGFAVTEGEWVTFDGKDWLITNWECDDQFRVKLTLAETGADVYSESGIEPGPIVVPPPVLINPSMLMTVQNFSVNIGMITNEDGENKPALEFTWTPPNDPTITQVRFEYKIDDGNGGDSNGTLIRDLTTDPESGSYITTKGVVGGKRHVARATITTVPDRLKSWTVWVSTPEPTGAASVRTMLEHFGQDAYALLQQAYAKFDEIDERLEQLAIAASDAAGEQVKSKGVAVRYRNATATALSEMRAVISDDGGNLIAVAELLDAVEATIGDLSAGVLWRMVASVGSGDVVSRVDLQVRATVGDDWISAGTIWEAGFVGGNPGAPFARIVMEAEQFIIWHNTTGYSPFVVNGGVVYIDNAMIADLSAEKLTAGTLKLDKWAPPTAGDNVISQFTSSTQEYGNNTTAWSPSWFLINHTISPRDGIVAMSTSLGLGISQDIYFGLGMQVIVAGTIRIKFEHKRTNTATSHARIMKNGSLVSDWTTTSSAFVARTLDVAVAVGDNITFQHRISAGDGFSYFRNFRVCSGNMTPAVY